MKILLLILLACSPAMAGLPDQIVDPNTRDVVEYINGKVDYILRSTGGITGPQGPSGPIGLTGPQGATGATGPAGTAATIAVGSSTTGGAGSAVYVNNSGDSTNAVFNFTIPKGDTGAQGIQGIQGIQGVPGDPAGNTFVSSITILGSESGYGLSVSSNVYIVGFSSATKYYGDGSSLTGLAGGGDVVKAATQTLTGINTFTGSVSMTASGTANVQISSLTVTNFSREMNFISSVTSNATNDLGTPALNTYVTVPSFNLSVSAGSYAITVKGALYVEQNNTAGYMSTGCALATSATPGNGVIGSAITGGITRYGGMLSGLFPIYDREYFTFGGATTLYVQCVAISFSGAPTVNTFQFRSNTIVTGPSFIMAERIK